MDESERPDDEGTGGSGRDVISSLPRHRPHRRSAKRGASRPAAAAAPAKPTAAASKPKPKAKPKATKTRPKPTPARERIGATAGAKTRDASARTAQKPRPAAEKPAGPPSGTELIGTAVQAAGELATIGLKLGSQVVKNAVGRLPKP